MMCMLARRALHGVAILTCLAVNAGQAEPAADAFDRSILPLLRDHCLTCHSAEKRAGELDLERFTSVAEVRRDIGTWQHVLEQVSLGEMPPADARPLSAEQSRAIVGWIQEMLDEVALASAGDPGPVVLRRLSNREYTATIQDLTGVASLDVAREFPADGAAGEGFTNTGAALVMSPALVQKYLDAAKQVARHCVLLPNGVRFSASDSPQDWTAEVLQRIRDFYARHTIATHIAATVNGAGQVTNAGGSIPLDRYLDALQGRGDDAGLSEKYLRLLREALTSGPPSPLLDPLRAALAAGRLTAADIEPWQQVLWRFTTVGHIGKANGPKAWQEPVTPLVARQEFRVAIDGGRDQTLYLVATNAGDGDAGDLVRWERPRLVAKGRPDIPLADLPGLVRHLEAWRARLIADTERCLAAIAAGTTDADAELLDAWRHYLGIGSTTLAPLLEARLERTPDYDFVRGWRGDRALSVLANSSDATVRIPGVMKARSVAAHPAPDRAAVIAWRSPVGGSLRIQGGLSDAHPECGNGVEWSLEVRRGMTTQRLAAGVSKGATTIPLGPFEDVRVEPGQVVAVVVGPRDGNHVCDLTAIDLTISDGTTTWNLAGDVSPDILAGNPHGVWHFLSQPAADAAGVDLPEPVAAWLAEASPERASAVRRHLEETFPLTHPLLASALVAFRPADATDVLEARAPAVLELTIPAALAGETEFVVSATLAPGSDGSVQAQVLTERPTAGPDLVAGRAESAQQKRLWSDHALVTRHDAPIIVHDGGAARARFERACDDFRALFPRIVCYSTIVPVDEVVTLTLYHREDDHLQRLLLDDEECRELDRLWDELRFVSDAPLKQVAVFEQLWQYATQDASPAAFDPIREPIRQAARDFADAKAAADVPQRQAVIDLAARAWRRPLTREERAELAALPPRTMLVRVLTSPHFLYRAEAVPETTGPVDDHALATRLSYFLWSSLPDAELRDLADAGALRDPAVLAAQARRMLRDGKVRRLATEFGCQWLHVRDVATLDEKSERHFPTFAALRGDMQEEVVRFFVDLFANDRDVLSLIDADHTFVNGPLARHYGLTVEGEDWRRVDGLRAIGRGGALGFAATLAKHAGASRTSAILRGTWLSETVLGERLPKPPKDVPVLPAESPAGLTERQLVERHSSDPRCAGCHRRIDPFGFALEGFDAIGGARAADTATTLPDGTEIDGLDGLRTYLVTTRRDDVLRQFAHKLLGYALGRSVQLSDEPLIDAMVAAEGRRAADLVELVVTSAQFRTIRGRSAADGGSR
jgi:mono/diheme cytochrome c family protein